MKNIEVDWDNPASLKKAITKLQFRRKELLRRLGYQEIKFDGSKYNMDNLMPLFESMLSEDFSSIYPSEGPKKYYVYVHCNPLQKLNAAQDIKELFLALKFGLEYKPFYVGKGTGNRYLDLSRNDSHRKIRQSIKYNNKDILPVKILDNLTEGEALALEAKLIDILGLASLSKYGMLVNLDESIGAIERRQLYSHELSSKLLLKNNYNGAVV